MKPIGLTLKDIKLNHFTGKTIAELMIVHLCIHCGRISCNRIAGDDNTFSIEQLLYFTDITSSEKNRIETSGIILLDTTHTSMVRTYLFGY